MTLFGEAAPEKEVFQKVLDKYSGGEKERAAANGIEIRDYMLRSRTENMRNTLDYFASHEI